MVLRFDTVDCNICGTPYFYEALLAKHKANVHVDNDEIGSRYIMGHLSSLVNVSGLNKLLRSKVCVNSDGQLRAVHLILDFTPLSDSFLDIGNSIRAGDKRINRIDVSILGFLAKRDLLPVEWPTRQAVSQHAVQREESASSLQSLEEEIDGFRFSGEEEVQGKLKDTPDLALVPHEAAEEAVEERVAPTERVAPDTPSTEVGAEQAKDAAPSEVEAGSSAAEPIEAGSLPS
ncbi:hypothetical protein SO802_014989 [Lithocarpus litseifolius]|uniref:C2H2-type domain-containing protein n=1 Tax=Lithocarpus litseifolius TaxID=425828 RepID=A0AAW2CUV5_9ROSI